MVLVETLVFTRRVGALLSDEDYRMFQLYILGRPQAGAVIRGAGGLRKVRWGAMRRGKRGGVRILYHWSRKFDRILLLFVFDKTERDDLTRDQLSILRRLVEKEYP